MKKTFIILAAAMMLAGCNNKGKDITGIFFGVDMDSLNFVPGYEYFYDKFVLDLNLALSYTQVEELPFLNAVKGVVELNDKQFLEGKVRCVKSFDEKEWQWITSYPMQTQNAYYSYESSAVTGSEEDIRALKKTMTVVVKNMVSALGDKRDDETVKKAATAQLSVYESLLGGTYYVVYHNLSQQVNDTILTYQYGR